jgi:hypothetical protein
MTEVRHAGFTAALPGAWHECSRTAETCHLEDSTELRALTVAVRPLANPVPASELLALGERLLAERRRRIEEEAGAAATWNSAEVYRRGEAAEGRCEGYLPSRQIHYALLERVTPDKILSAALQLRGDLPAGAAYSNLAGVIFEQLEDV